jgi:hypothetical protein
MDFDSFATMKGYLSWPLYKLDALHVSLSRPSFLPSSVSLKPFPRPLKQQFELTLISFQKFIIPQDLLFIIFLNAMFPMA